MTLYVFFEAALYINSFLLKPMMRIGIFFLNPTFFIWYVQKYFEDFVVRILFIDSCKFPSALL